MQEQHPNKDTIEVKTCGKCWELNSIGARGNIKEGLEVNSNEFLQC